MVSNIFTLIRGRFPIWRSYFSDGLKPPTTAIWFCEPKVFQQFPLWPTRYRIQLCYRVIWKVKCGWLHTCISPVPKYLRCNLEEGTLLAVLVTYLAFSIRSNTATTHPRVLLCDEPTAACDLQTDRQIHETLLHGFLVAKFGKAFFFWLWVFCCWEMGISYASSFFLEQASGGRHSQSEV